jgi:hypothetical protein
MNGVRNSPAPEAFSRKIQAMQNVTQLVKELQEMRDQGFLSDALLRHAVKKVKRDFGLRLGGGLPPERSR